MNLFMKWPPSLHVCLALCKMRLAWHVYLAPIQCLGIHLINMAGRQPPKRFILIALSLLSRGQKLPGRSQKVAQSAYILIPGGQRPRISSLAPSTLPDIRRMCSGDGYPMLMLVFFFLAKHGDWSMAEFQEACDSRKLVK